MHIGDFFLARYNPGACAVRWAIPLAAIAALDAATLAALAFILASRHVRLQPEPFNNGSLYKGTYHSHSTADKTSSRESYGTSKALFSFF